MTIRKLESPNSSSFSLYFFKAASPSSTRASEDASNLKLVIPAEAITKTKKIANNTINGLLITNSEYFFIKFFTLFICTLW